MSFHNVSCVGVINVPSKKIYEWGWKRQKKCAVIQNAVTKNISFITPLQFCFCNQDIVRKTRLETVRTYDDTNKKWKN